MADEHPIRRVVELGVYAPVGLAVLVAEHVPELVERGRARIEPRLTLARFIGKMVVDQGRREVERRIGPPEPESLRPTRTVPDPEAAPGRVPMVRAPAVPAPSGPTPMTEDLAIVEYESLSAGQVVGLLDGLDAAELDRVEAFEVAHRNRRTVLGRIAQLRDSR